MYSKKEKKKHSIVNVGLTGVVGYLGKQGKQGKQGKGKYKNITYTYLVLTLHNSR